MVFYTICFQKGFTLKANGMAMIYRRPQVFEKSGFPCFSKTLAQGLQS
jgi:hypothetical protein